MRYLGGKTKLARKVTDVLKVNRLSGQEFVEPFMGGASISVRMDNPRSLYDANHLLVEMWNELLEGKIYLPDGPILEDDYKCIKTDPHHPLYTLVGFGLSYAGCWWQGYDGYYDRRGKVGYTWEMLKNSIAKKVERLRGAAISQADYRTLNPKDALVYCDPPYANSKEYAGQEGFDSDEFWDVVRRWSKDNTVIVSERVAPSDFESIWEHAHNVQMTKNQVKTTEKLFLESWVAPWEEELSS